MELGELRTLVESGEIDTVVVGLTDMQGRLQGKRCQATHFLDELVEHPTEACNYLLAVDVEMNTVGGYTMSSWEQGYGDFVLAHDLSTLRRLPWEPGAVLVLCDIEWLDGRPVAASPRQVLRRQIERLAEHGLVALAGTELEFIVFDTSYDEAAGRRYTGLRPATRYNVDYALGGTSKANHLLRRIRNEMAAAGMVVESAKGECNLGQFEIAFRFADAMTTADNHVVYKAGAKEIAAQEGMSLTFMAKYDEREGSSCHVHLSVRDGETGAAVMAGEATSGLSLLGERFLAGQHATLRELSLLFAPNINSYKRFQPGSFAPTAVAWGRDNRTCALRLVGHGPSLRVENRVPGGDANPYLALAAVIAGGLHGLEHRPSLPDEFAGNAYVSGGDTVPTTLREAADLFGRSEVAREAFGDDVVDHYVNAARVELAAFDAAVTDWERVRSFERM
jgi:glutamine synthetase